MMNQAVHTIFAKLVQFFRRAEADDLVGLSERFSGLQKEFSNLNAAAAQLKAENTSLRNELSSFQARRVAGYIVEFDYPYRPSLRRWEGAQDNCGRIIEAGHSGYQAELASFLKYKHEFKRISLT